MTNTLDLTIWDREFSLNVDYDVLEDEEVSQEQLDAIKAFARQKEWIDRSKKSVEEYCKKSVLADDANQMKDNIFSYIKPDYIFVKRGDKKHRIALMCRYRYDEENGLAIVFDSKGCISVGPQDIIL